MNSHYCYNTQLCYLSFRYLDVRFGTNSDEYGADYDTAEGGT